ncbi:hypothetical protein [Actinoplanes subtropicus]|uniref:hypothetical protein n=1 Tax=Actinoplanes subtropicus TaxID=543632 RepID=UPI0004C43E2F|nr:hypothetical protein [Actinoplanes subtropicus]
MTAEPWTDPNPDFEDEDEAVTVEVDRTVHTTMIEGDQYNAHTLQIFQQAAERLRADTKNWHVDAETLAERVRLFRPPPGLEEQVSRLRDERLVILSCERNADGCGQQSAASYLVHQVSRSLTFQVAFLDDDTDLAESAAGTEHAGLYFDAVELGADARGQLRQLSQLKSDLERIDCLAVLAISDDIEDEAKQWFPGHVHRLARRNAEDVFRAHADPVVEGPLVDRLVSDSWLVDELRTAWPPSAASLAGLAVKAVQSGIQDPDAIINDLKNARNAWLAQARDDMRNNAPTAPKRALLIAAATLEGAGPAVLAEARDRLLAAAKYRIEPSNALEQPDIIQGLEELRKTTLDPETTRFTRPDYGSALLHHVWREYPMLQPILRAWFDQLPVIISGASPGIDRLVDRVVELSSHIGNGRLAVQIARRWAEGEQSGRQNRQAAAILLLRQACLHPRIGHDARGRVYTTAQARTYSPTFRVAMAVALGEFDAKHRSTGMTRLKHLAGHPENVVREATTSAVIRLTEDLEIGQILGYFAEWLALPDPNRAYVVIDAASEIMVARAGAPADIDPEPSVRFWRRVLDALAADDAGQLIRQWLRLGNKPEPAIRTLLAAAGSDLRRIGQLMYAVRPAPEPDPDNDPLADLLRQVRLRLDELSTPRTRV